MKKINSKIFLLRITGLITIIGLFAFTGRNFISKNIREYHIDSIAFPQYIKQLITYNQVYPYIRYNQNYVEWQDYSSISSFFTKIKQTQTRKLKILHIGDSHVQADIFTGYVRNELQNILGHGGRGFVFPYAAAATHAAYDYKTSSTGAWEFSRNIQPAPDFDMGITGVTVYTEDSTAGFKLIFPNGTLQKNDNVLKIYCRRAPDSYDLKLKASGVDAPLYIDCNAFNDKLYIEIKLPQASDTLSFTVNETDTIQKSFECYGLMIETAQDKGVLYNSVGINGAGLSSLLKENLLLYQLSELKPDLVVVDLGLNDFYKTAFKSKEIEKTLNNIIDIIQRASPDASIILSSGQDVYYRNFCEKNCKTYSELMREIAFRKGCAFYDYYYISGGQNSMLKWKNDKLAKYDKVHLTSAGYFVRGELFLNALLGSYLVSLNKPEIKNLIASAEFPDTTKILATIAHKVIPLVKDTDVTNNIIKEQTKVWKTQTTYYKIKPGENLGLIAQKNKVTISQLKTWNKIKGTIINAGETLVIYKQVLVNEEDVPTTTKSTTTTVQPKPKTTTGKTTTTANKTSTGTKKYTVLKGDNLWKIANKFGTSVNELKKLNNFKSDALKAGQVIIIKK